MSYVNPQSVFGMGVAFIVLGTTAVAARFAVRTKKGGLGVEDWLCLPALVFVLTQCGIMIAGSQNGSIGHHSPELGPGIATYLDDAQVMLEKLEITFYIVQVMALVFLKLSMLFFYRRLFCGRAFDIISWALIGFCCAWAVAFIVALGTVCGNDIQKDFGSLGERKAECNDVFTLIICLSVFDVVADLAILILPLPMIWKLQTSVQRRIGVTISLMVGALAVACAITRMSINAYLLGPALFSREYIIGLRSDDDMGIVSTLIIWGMLETGIGMVAICLPTLRPLFHGLSPESIVNSLRSVLSLSSRHDTRTPGVSDTKDARWSSSDSHLVFSGPASVAHRAEADVEMADYKQTHLPPARGVMVHTNINQSVG